MPPSDTQNERIQVERLRLAEIRRQRDRAVGEHVAAIKTARRDLEAKLVELQGHCDRLQQATRRVRGDGEDPRYRIYHTAQTRMVGAMGQALKRAQATDRLLETSRVEQQERERNEREEAARARVKTVVQDVFNLQLPKDNDFEQLFGEETADGS
jgi:hypothetical protein